MIDWSAPWLAPGLLEHLPVLGIPGWCAANEDSRYYEDESVFGPLRRVASDKREAA
jgi:hypothetical protein